MVAGPAGAAAAGNRGRGAVVGLQRPPAAVTSTQLVRLPCCSAQQRQVDGPRLPRRQVAQSPLQAFAAEFGRRRAAHVADAFGNLVAGQHIFGHDVAGIEHFDVIGKCLPDGRRGGTRLVDRQAGRARNRDGIYGRGGNAQ